MAVLTVGDVRQIRAWVGTSPPDSELQERADDLAGAPLLAVARQILQERLGTLSASPALWGADGDYNESNVATITLLSSQIADLSLLLDGHRIPGFDPTQITSASAALFRTDRERLT